MSIGHLTLSIRPVGARQHGRPAGPGEGLRLPLAWLSGGLSVLLLLSSAQPARAADVSALFAAIRQVESGGDDSAVGDGGRARGPYQMHLGAWLDSGGKASDYPRLAHSRPACEAAMLRYWARYHATTDEARCRIWNGGPRGMHKAATLKYWRKVRSAMGRTSR